MNWNCHPYFEFLSLLKSEMFAIKKKEEIELLDEIEIVIVIVITESVIIIEAIRVSIILAELPVVA